MRQGGGFRPFFCMSPVAGSGDVVRVSIAHSNASCRRRESECARQEVRELEVGQRRSLRRSGSCRCVSARGVQRFGLMGGQRSNRQRRAIKRCADSVSQRGLQRKDRGRDDRCHGAIVPALSRLSIRIRKPKKESQSFCSRFAPAQFYISIHNNNNGAFKGQEGKVTQEGQGREVREEIDSRTLRSLGSQDLQSLL